MFINIVHLHKNKKMKNYDWVFNMLEESREKNQTPQEKWLNSKIDNISFRIANNEISRRAGNKKLDNFLREDFKKK